MFEEELNLPALIQQQQQQHLAQQQQVLQEMLLRHRWLHYQLQLRRYLSVRRGMPLPLHGFGGGGGVIQGMMTAGVPLPADMPAQLQQMAGQLAGMHAALMQAQVQHVQQQLPM
jgi:hypothetical protein